MHSIEELIADIRQGRMVILLDDEDRENEGDLVMAATHVTPADLNFMITYGRGMICMPLTEAQCVRLALPLMVQENNCNFGTQFTISIEAAQGVTTGVSVSDRAHTIRTAANPDAIPADIVMPGHVFPLCARPRGVLDRAGHTEATCDLVALAGLPPVGVICEILDAEGESARRPLLELFAKQHHLKMGTVADLVAYRKAKEIVSA